ncbi:MAG TPA: beta-ketoacyl-[acyl-carrier-protein] synthase family protein [Pyrinomonadaceae bacterium]|nr:beta-ketoacyl-[acyl-carrier-protein] synthase family protein [Pyrinomonadaceae bacterium]
MDRRVVITGIGVITPIGAGCKPFWNNLLEGRSGIGPVKSFDTSKYDVHCGSEVKDFNAADYLQNLDAAHLGRASQFAIAAARLALTDAGVDMSSLDRKRAGVSMGTTSGEPLEVERFDDAYVNKNLDRIGPEFLALYPCHVVAQHVGSELDFAGVNMMFPTACAAGNYAIAHAFDVLRSGRADVMLAGGSDAFSRITFTGFARLGAVAPHTCQPFDRFRKGMIPGEGAGVLVLERFERARKRSARIYAEVAGYGLSCDAHHMTAAHPRGDGAARAMQQALTGSGTRPEEVGYISAHGTGTPTNDRLETIAVKRVFKDLAYRIPISSIKSMLGHTMGAASAIEAAVCALAVFDDRVPPTINLTEPDPECDLDYVPNYARELPIKVAMNNAYAFGGNNASLLVRKWAESN